MASYAGRSRAGLAAAGVVAGALTAGAWRLVPAPPATWPVTMAAVGLPALCLGLCLRLRSIGGTRNRLFAELAGGLQRAGGGSVDMLAQAVVTAAGRLLQAAEVEMVLLGADGPVRYVGDGAALSRRRVDADAFDQPWVTRALGTGGVRSSADDGRPYCSAVVGGLRDPTGALAVLVIRRAPGAARFGRRDIRLVRLLVAQAERWLCVGGPVSLTGAFGPRGAVETAEAGAPGPYSGPDLTLLRDSARRLSLLASAPGGPEGVGQIVEELHSVERAVASLLGALAMATARQVSDHAELVSAAPSPAQRAAQEWTTTGVLESTESLEAAS
jgi:hypothetical protein